MTIHDALTALERAGGEQTRKTYRRHGSGENVFGVSFAELGKLKKQIRRDHSLALALWETGNADARNLALMIADPRAVAADTLEKWAWDLESGFLCSTLAQFVAETGVAQEKVHVWSDCGSEWVECTGWLTLARLAGKTDTSLDSWFDERLGTIEREIHARQNMVRETMVTALAAIGIEREMLRERALGVAEKIGKVQVDHGDTACQTPDPGAQIRKAVARKK